MKKKKQIMNTSELIKLNFSSSGENFDDFINVTFSKDFRLDYEKNSVDEIYSKNYLNNYSIDKIELILSEWNRILKNGALLNLILPAFDLQVKAYLRGDWDIDFISKMIFNEESDSKQNSMVFDKNNISKYLQNNGFSIVDIEAIDYSNTSKDKNIQMEIKANKQMRIKQMEIEESSSYSDFDFNEVESFANNDQNIEDEPLFDIDILKELVDIKSIDQRDSNINIPDLNIVWEGSQFVYHSFALINREHCSNILDSNTANLTIIPYENDTFDFKLNSKYIRLHDNDVRHKKPVSEEIDKLPYVWIRHQWPPKSEPPKGAKWIIMQPWEYNRLPKNFVSIFNAADELWVPSEFSKRSFIDSGIDRKKVFIIPNGINPKLYSPEGKKFNLDTKKKFKLLYLGGTIYRKGIDILLNAYKEAFSSDDDICLVIKDMGTDSFYKGQTIKDNIEEFQKEPNSPEILYLYEDLHEDDIAALYRSCNLFVASYRGEGFSLPTLEAMACGLPVVVTRGGAADDFVGEGLGFLINSTKISVGNKVAGLDFEEETFLLEPEKEHLSSILTFLYSNPGILKSIGLVSSFYARTIWTWKNSTIKMLSRLDALYQKNMAVTAARNIPNYSDAYITMSEAEVEYNAGNYEESYFIYKRAVNSGQLDKFWSCHCLNRMIILAIDKKDLKTAEELLQKVKFEGHHCPDSKYLEAVFFSAQNNFNQSLNLITELLQDWNSQKYNSSFGINLDDILVLGGDIMRAASDLDGAVRMYKNALKINHENYFACHGAGMCFKLAGDKAMAKEMFNWVLKYAPNYELSLKELADL